jgi:hypothetical protein
MRCGLHNSVFIPRQCAPREAKVSAKKAKGTIRVGKSAEWGYAKQVTFKDCFAKWGTISRPVTKFTVGSRVKSLDN